MATIALHFMSTSLRRILALGGFLLLSVGLIYGLHVEIVGGLSPSTVLDPMDGLYRTARQATPSSDSTQLTLSGLDEPATIVRDERHVPHIYAASDRDAIIALGYVIARDRLFQLDFLPRVASGRLAEAFGSEAVQSDRFLRGTGMEWGAQKNLERIRSDRGTEWDALRWYGKGVNAYLDRLGPEDLPLEFRLLGFQPDRFSPVQGLRVLQYMSYDLTYTSDDPAYTKLRRTLDEEAYETLYPQSPAGLFVPIIPREQQLVARRTNESGDSLRTRRGGAARSVGRERRQGGAAVDRLLGSAKHPGKGSNNWAVHADRSETGAPLLAGDMHLSISLPSIWYEAHLVTPSMNAYGLTIPGAPVLVQAFNENVGWTMTNTGTDQIDHLLLDLDTTRTQYRYEGEWRELRPVVDTIRVNGGPSVLDTTYFSHHGPVHFSGDGRGGTAVAERWVAHEPSRTLHALWKMNRAEGASDVEDALQFWDTPMQNVLYAGVNDTIAIRSAGYLPIRRAGHGRGLVDGTTDDFEWVGRVPFDSLPAAQNPRQAFLASANQKPTGSDYPYYLGHDWGDGYRSLRIDSLLRGSQSHSVADFQRYQADVEAQQRHVFFPFLESLDGLSSRADTLRQMLSAWDGHAGVDRPEPLILDEFLTLLRRKTWDERVFATAPTPNDAALVDLLRRRPNSRWLDVQSTAPAEDAEALLTSVLEETTDTMETKYGWTPEEWRWGNHHEVLFRHLSGSELLRPLWRGPYESPGFEATLFPGRGRTVTHTASQRVIVDFSTSPPTGYGVYPGGQRGTPLDPYFYDTQIPTYLDFDYFRLNMPEHAADIAEDRVRSIVTLQPASP